MFQVETAEQTCWCSPRSPPLFLLVNVSLCFSGCVGLMAQTLVVSSFAEPFCLQFARSPALCLCSSLPPSLPLFISLSFLHEMNANENYTSHFLIVRVGEWAAQLPLVPRWLRTPQRVSAALETQREAVWFDWIIAFQSWEECDVCFPEPLELPL